MEDNYNQLAQAEILQLVMDSTNEIIWVIDTNFCLLFGNKAYYNAVKLTGGNITQTGQNVLSKDYSEENLKFWKNNYEKCFQGLAFSVTLKHQWADKIHYTENILNPLKNQYNKIIGAIVISRDITTQKELEIQLSENEQILREQNNEYATLNEEYKTLNDDLHIANEIAINNETKLRTVINALPDLIWLKNNEGFYLLCNQRFEDFFGAKEKDIVGKTDYDFMSKELADFFRAHDKNAAQAGKPTINEEEITFANDGHKEFLETIKTPVYNPKNKIVGVLGIGRDITKRKLSEKALIEAKNKIEEREKQLTVIYENSGLSIFVIKILENGEYIFEGINPTHEKLMNIKNSEIAGKTPDEMIYHFGKDAVDYVKALYNECVEKRTTITSEFYIPQGLAQGWWLSRITPIIQNNKVTKLIGGSIDISERKKIENELIRAKEKAEESDRLKTSFLNNMSHEIRTPLNAIQGFAGLLTKQNQSIEKIERFSDLINQNTDKLINIINDVIEVAQIKTNQIQVKYTDFNIIAVITDIYNDYKNKKTNKAILFRLNINTVADEIILHSDKYKITRILSHLVENAFKFTQQGTIEISLNTNNNFLKITISDTGIGITPEMQQIIFEPFHQVETGATRNYGGNGLGLSIVKSFTQLLNGSITLHSELNKGTSFIITFPLSIPAAGTKTEHNTTNINNKKRVLIVEDEYSNYLFVKEILDSFGVDIDYAENGQQALEICTRENNIDLILMDIKMPVMDGYTAAKLIKEFRAQIPVIAQTAYALEDEKEKFSHIFDDYITKPIKVFDFKQILHKYIKL